MTIDESRAARSGRLSTPWRVMLGVTWVAAFLAYASVNQASVQIGIGTWWLGPRAQPTAPLVRMIPFALSLMMLLLQIYNIPRHAHVSIVGALLAAAIAVPDLSRSVGLAVVEFAIAGCTLLVSLAALSGQQRLVPALVQPPIPGEWAPPVADATQTQHAGSSVPHPPEPAG